MKNLDIEIYEGGVDITDEFLTNVNGFIRYMSNESFDDIKSGTFYKPLRDAVENYGTSTSIRLLKAHPIKLGSINFDQSFVRFDIVGTDISLYFRF